MAYLISKMRVKDPLQGIKILKGHTIMHFAFYATMRHVKTLIYTDPDAVPLADVPEIWREQLKIAADYEIFEYMKAGHLACGIL